VDHSILPQTIEGFLTAIAYSRDPEEVADLSAMLGDLLKEYGRTNEAAALECYKHSKMVYVHHEGWWFYYSTALETVAKTTELEYASSDSSPEPEVAASRRQLLYILWLMCGRHMCTENGGCVLMPGLVIQWDDEACAYDVANFNDITLYTGTILQAAVKIALLR